MPEELHRRYYLGKLCPKTHRYEDSDFSVRKRSNHGCAICNEQYNRSPRPQRMRSLPYKPELPPHLAETCFLSPIRCEVEAHHWRDSALTLRFLEDEVCVMCVTTRASLAGTPLPLAGD